MATLVTGVLAPQQSAAARGDDGEPRPPRISVTDLTTPDGLALLSASEINDRGEIVGALPAETSGSHPVLWRRGAVTSLVPPGVRGYALDLSERGDVVGFYLPRPWDVQPFRWSRDEGWSRPPSELPAGAAADVNDRGQVLGMQMRSIDLPPWEVVVWERDGEMIEAPPGAVTLFLDYRVDQLNDRGQVALALQQQDGARAVIWQVGGEVLDLGTLGGATARATAINEAGDVTGFSSTSGGEEHAFLWRDGEMTDLGTLGGRSSSPVALNERGDVVGTSATTDGEVHAFLWRDGQMTRLGSLGGTNDSFASHPNAVNDRGQVVGTSYTPDGRQHAVLWHEGRTIDLGELVGGETSAAADINDRGRIVGSVTEGESSRAVLWTVR